MRNTPVRLLSGIILILIAASAIIFGRQSTLGLMLLFSLLAVEELLHNFAKVSRTSFHYFLGQGLMFIPFAYLNYMEQSFNWQIPFIWVAVGINIVLLAYLFLTDPTDTKFKSLLTKLPFLSGLFILFPMMTVASYLQETKWRELLGAILIITYAMDSGAWFFGKFFGSHKLWPKVSPNKTIEGLVGGAFTSAILGSLYWHYVLGQWKLSYFFLFMLLGIMSQIGDLIQSKIKRQFQLKDSSSLIPGHGGVYDRLDSLLFSSPFFAMIVTYSYNVK